jgi:hypothetical protein
MGTGLPAILILGAGLTIAVSAFIHPFGMVRGQSDDKPLFAGTG